MQLRILCNFQYLGIRNSLYIVFSGTAKLGSYFQVPVTKDKVDAPERTD
jgi:hypothetical protein